MRKKALSSASSCRELSLQEKRLLFQKGDRITSISTSFRGGQQEKEGRHDVRDVQVFETISLVTSEYYDVHEYSQSLGRRSHPSLLYSDSLL